MTNVVGLDACKMGWCGIGQVGDDLFWGCYSHLDDLINHYPNLQHLLIDIPIGLTSHHFTRTIDTKARTYLNKRKSSIFSPPCREALYAKDYKEALAINREITGKGLSIQAYNIGPKIKAVDEWYSQKPQHLDVYEAHPELCFKTLNHNTDLEYSKHDKQGLEERRRLLFRKDKRLKAIYHDLLNTYKRKAVKPDDILDAMALYIVGSTSTDFSFIADQNSIDANGKPVRLVVGGN